MVGVTKIQRQNANYWIEAVAGGAEDYYSKPGEAPGRWLGSAAPELGLSGEIDRAAYAAALAGQHPVTGEPLVNRPPPRTFTDAAGRTRHAEPVLGFDVRFSAPKSVSLLYAIGSPEVRAAATRAHDDAVAEALSYLEERACFVQRGRGGARIEPAAGFLAMAFRHRSSRAGDPALHTHVLVANLTRASSDGRWLSLASPRRRSPLFHQAKAAGRVYQAALRANVTRELGLEWRAPHNGHADLVIFKREVIEHFSQRRVEIERALAASGNFSPRAAEVAAYRTREAKDYGVDLEDRREDWLARAEEFGLTPAAIDAELSSTTPRHARQVDGADLDAALASLEASRSHFDRRELLCALAEQLPEGASGAELAAAVDALISSERLVEVHAPANPLAPTSFTTPRLAALEQRFTELATAGADADASPVDAASLATVLERHGYLGADQVEMVRRITAGAERIVAVAARPGTGKTTALAAAREAWERCGHPVIGVASARSASGELADAGIPSTSITALLIRTGEWEAQGAEPLRAGTVIICDEASTASTPQMAALAELVHRCDGKLVVVGDPRQIGAVGPGGLYAHLTKVTEPAVLTEIRRQRQPSDRRVVELAHQGRGSDALDLLRSKDCLWIADTLPEVLDALVLDWHKQIRAGEDAVMIARRTRDVADLNRRARELLAAERDDDTPNVRVGETEFALGDQVITRINSDAVSNRERWQVSGVDPAGESIALQRIGGDGRAVTLDSRYLTGRTQRGELALQHAYALTAYATEAKTFDSAFVLLDAGITREEFLVEISRARGQTFAYGVASLELTDPELGPAARAIEDTAHELRAASERAAPDFAAAEVELREQIWSLPGSELARRRAQIRSELAGRRRLSPQERRAQSIEKRLAGARSHSADLKAAGEALRSRRGGSRQLQGRIDAELHLAGDQVDRLQAERDQLTPTRDAPSELAANLENDQRLQLGLIEERIDQLARRTVALERLQPSAQMIAVLGERPADPASALLWNEGVHAIYAHRHRYDIFAREGDPLGQSPADPAENREWRQAGRTLKRVQVALELDTAPGIERALG